MVSLEKSFSELPPPAARCRTCIWVNQLDAKDKAFFDSKLTGNKKNLWRAAQSNGLTAHYDSFRNHLTYHHIPGHHGAG